MPASLSCTGLTKKFSYTPTRSPFLQDWLIKRGWKHPTWSVVAVNNLTFSMQPGEWVGIYGPNGSGKTTLMRLLARLLPPDTGEVMVGGKLSAFLGLGVGFEPELTAEKNIYLHGLLHGMTRPEIARVTEQIIMFAGVQSHHTVPIKCYSSGMQLRLAFAAAAHIEADIYLFDEVLAVGDSAFEQKCLEHLASLRSAGKTVLLVSHDLLRLQTLCDRVLHMQDGRLIREEFKKPASSLAPQHSE